MKPPPIPWTTFFAIVFALAGAACLVLAEQPIWPFRGHAYALAVERGRQEAFAPVADSVSPLDPPLLPPSQRGRE
jgi:hypothetical protein